MNFLGLGGAWHGEAGPGGVRLGMVWNGKVR